MNVTRTRSFRCHYRHAVPGQAPHALFLQLRARDAQHAQQLAEAALGLLIDRVEPTPAPQLSTTPAKEL